MSLFPPSVSLKTVFNDALPLFDKFAPTFAAAIGGVPGLAFSFVIPILAKAFKSKSDHLPDLVNTILADHTAPQKLAALEAEHCDWLCELFKHTKGELNVKIDFNKDS